MDNIPSFACWQSASWDRERGSCFVFLCGLEGGYLGSQMEGCLPLNAAVHIHDALQVFY